MKYIPIIFLVLVTSCSYSTSLRYDYFPPSERLAESEKLQGSGLIVMSPSEETYIYEDNPASFTGSANTVSIEIGQITKSASLKIFNELFSEGAYFVNNPNDFNGSYILSIEPISLINNYKFDQLSNLGFAITPKVSIEVKVKVLNKDGEILFNQNYSVNDKSQEAYFFSGNPDEKVNELVHKEVYNMLKQSFNEIRRDLIE